MAHYTTARMKTENHWKFLLETIVEEAGRKRSDLKKLRRILGYGEPIYQPQVPPVGMARDEWMETLESGGEDLHLSDGIVSIVAEMKFPGPLCRAVLDLKPEQQWLNFDTLQAAAPGILAALGLRDMWLDWFDTGLFGAPSTCATDSSMMYEFIDRGIRSDFLIYSMTDRYFAEQRVDFSELFPPCSEEHAHVLAMFKKQLTQHIAPFFEEASIQGRPDRPDIIFQAHSCLRNLKKELMESADAGQCVRLAAEYVFLKTDPAPQIYSAESFLREQRDRHFGKSGFPG